MKEINQMNNDEFTIYVDLCHAGRLKNVKCRPEQTIANVKENITKKMKEQLGIEMKPGDYYLKHIRIGILTESRTVRDLK